MLEAAHPQAAAREHSRLRHNRLQRTPRTRRPVGTSTLDSKRCCIELVGIRGTTVDNRFGSADHGPVMMMITTMMMMMATMMMKKMTMMKRKKKTMMMITVMMTMMMVVMMIIMMMMMPEKTAATPAWTMLAMT